MTESEADHRSRAGLIIWTTLLLSLGYAVLRYHIVGTVPWKALPFFILNKAIALSSIILITLNFTLGPLKNLGVKLGNSFLRARKALGMTGFLLVLVHGLMSFVLIKPEIFAKFYDETGRLTLFAGISMLAGILGFVVLWVMNLSFQTKISQDKAFIGFITSRFFLLTALLLGGIHVFFMGLDGWLKPDSWQGGLPPISLIAFAFSSIGYVINLVGRE